jgi:hypothetical protein
MRRQNSKSMIVPSTRYTYAWDYDENFWTRLDLDTGFTERLIGVQWVRSTESVSGVPIHLAASGDWTMSINAVGLGRVIDVGDYLIAPVYNGPVYGTRDGIAWGNYPSVTGQIVDVVKANGEYVVVRWSSPNLYLETTSDFLTYVTRQTITGVSSLPNYACLATDGEIVMYAGGSPGTDNVPMWSNDNFATKTDITGAGNPSKTQTGAISYLNGIWIFVGQAAGNSYTSTTTPASGNWTLQPDIYSTQQSHGTYVDGLWCGDRWWSNDGVTWKRSTQTSVTTTGWNCFNDGVRAYYPASGLAYNLNGPHKYAINPGRAAVAHFQGVWVGWSTDTYYYL